MPLYIDPKKIVRFIFPEDRELPEGEQPKFLLRVPTARDQIEIQELLGKASASASADGGVNPDGVSSMIAASFEILRRCWCGVEDWKRDDGTPIEFDAIDGRPTDEMLVSLSQTSRLELMNECVKLMGLAEEDRD